jgi:hypothetical protein
MKKLFYEWENKVHFLEVFIRQAHPGPAVPFYDSYERKAEDARAYKTKENIPWTVVVDDLDGTVHQAYGGLADPSYVLNADGNVAFYNTWTFAPTLHRALARLAGSPQACVVGGGVDKIPRLLPSLINGWPAIERGLPQSYEDLQRAAPGSAIALKTGYRFKSLMTPVTTRSKPLPPAVVTIAWGMALLCMARRIFRRSKSRCV